MSSPKNTLGSLWFRYFCAAQNYEDLSGQFHGDERVHSAIETTENKGNNTGFNILDTSLWQNFKRSNRH